jgi:hypothetical protein
MIQERVRVSKRWASSRRILKRGKAGLQGEAPFF